MDSEYDVTSRDGDRKEFNGPLTPVQKREALTLAKQVTEDVQLSKAKIQPNEEMVESLNYGELNSSISKTVSIKKQLRQ